MNKLPPGAQRTFTEAGVAHFLLYARDTARDTVHCFDFGPVGGRETTLAVTKGEQL
jgi:hypothetical protein